MPAPSIISGRVYYSAGNAASRTVSSVNTTGGSLLLIKVSMGDAQGGYTPSSVTFNGSSTGIVLHGSQIVLEGATNRGAAHLYYLNAPTATTASVVVTFGDFTRAVVVCEVWQDSDPTTPLKAAATAASTGSGSTAPSVTVTSGASGDTITDVVAVRRVTTDTATLTVGAGQTQIENQTSGSGSIHVNGGGSHEAGGASVVMSWTCDQNPWAIVAAPVAAAAAASAKRPLWLR